MKRFLLRSGLFGLLFIGLWVAMTVIALVEQPNRRAYMYAHRQKMAMIDSLPSPRIIIVGGSSVAFGFSAAQLGSSLGVNVINAGTNADVGLRFLLSDVAGRLRRGDLLILVPELEQFTDAYYGANEAMTSAAVYSGAKSLRYLNFRQWAIFLAGVPSHLKLNGVVPSETYNSSNFNEVGDEVRHLSASAPTDMPRMNPFVGPVSEDALYDLAAKIRELESRGCTVLLVGPSCVESYFTQSSKGIDLLSRALADRGLRPAAPIDFFVRPDSMVFDSPCHLNAAGVDENTRRLRLLIADSDF